MDTEPDIDELYVGNPSLSQETMRALYTEAWREVREDGERGSVAVLGRLFVNLYPQMEIVLASTFGMHALDNEIRAGAVV